MTTPTEWITERRVVVREDPADVAAVVADRLTGKLVRWTRKKRPVHLSLTGGSMGGSVLRAVGADPRQGLINWSRVHFWWSDERFVPRADGDRNALQAREALLDHIEVPADNIHEMASTDDGMDLDAAAAAYAAELARFGTPRQPWPSFRVCLLGVGPDAHIASLFPDRDEIRIADSSTAAVRDSPKPPPERVTVTRPVINSSERVWMALAGADKASALGLTLTGASYASVPAAGAKGRKRTVLFVDTAAAAHVPPELIDPDAA
ncbi:MAG: 6-phosphogluconolactonase [Microbacterium sp.]|uniref:6-phosphogluconolactonase n=1 Tax=Microbacterium sp. TaxID=51671 RepID=UPI0039E27E5D